jgi:hypothetical protein
MAMACTPVEEPTSSIIEKATPTIDAVKPKEAILQPSVEITEASPSKGSATENVEIEASAAVNHSSTLSRGDQTYTDLIDVDLTFTGGVAADAYRVKLISLMGEGNPDEPLERVGRRIHRGNIINDERTDLLLINHDERDSGTDELFHPDNGFHFSITFMPVEGLERISRLSGKLEVQVPTQVIVFDKVQSLINSKIKHPELDVLGDFILIKNESVDPPFYQLTGVGHDLEPISIRLIKPNGEYLYPDGIVWLKGDKAEELQIAGFHSERLEGTQLEFTLAYDTFELPFELINLKIEP